jgi:hypothetical protein
MLSSLILYNIQTTKPYLFIFNLVLCVALLQSITITPTHYIYVVHK